MRILQKGGTVMEANLKVKLEEAVDAAQQAAIDTTHAIYLHL